MLGDTTQDSDLTIWWPRKAARLHRILASGRCPSYSTPQHVREPGALVVLADKAGTPQLIFKLKRIDRGQAGIGADGKRFQNGCYLVAERGTMRRPGPRDLERVPINRNAMGALHYFSARTGASIIRDLSRRSESGIRTPRRTTAPHVDRRRVRVRADNRGKVLDTPESALIARYMRWVGREGVFERGRVHSDDPHTDLFIRPLYTLVEAKSTVTREDIRYAIGQLFDYQRSGQSFKRRHPSLAVLLPLKPATSMLDLLASKKIGVIWQTRGSKFVDLSNGRFTEGLRA